ncbi:SNARE-like associated protein [Cutibacterium acnes JCM 18920]|nr:SNARE-like associated protein [Cutibacterium acnes JCM 18920]
MNLTAWMASINGVIAASAPHPWVIGALWGLCVVDGFFPSVPSESLVVAWQQLVIRRGGSSSR